jgi:hypothetical protein
MAFPFFIIAEINSRFLTLGLDILPSSSYGRHFAKVGQIAMESAKGMRIRHNVTK